MNFWRLYGEWSAIVHTRGDFDVSHRKNVIFRVIKKPTRKNERGKTMLKNLDELMMKMCVCENNGVGVEVDGAIYFFEDSEGEDAISRIYRQFRVSAKMTFYSMTWAHQRRIKEFMSLYENAVKYCEAGKVERLENVIAKHIANWSGCTVEQAIKQVKNQKVSYISI